MSILSKVLQEIQVCADLNDIFHFIGRRLSSFQYGIMESCVCSMTQMRGELLPRSCYFINLNQLGQRQYWMKVCRQTSEVFEDPGKT